MARNSPSNNEMYLLMRDILKGFKGRKGGSKGIKGLKGEWKGVKGRMLFAIRESGRRTIVPLYPITPL